MFTFSTSPSAYICLAVRLDVQMGSMSKSGLCGAVPLVGWLVMLRGMEEVQSEKVPRGHACDAVGPRCDSAHQLRVNAPCHAICRSSRHAAVSLCIRPDTRQAHHRFEVIRRTSFYCEGMATPAVQEEQLLELLLQLKVRTTSLSCRVLLNLLRKLHQTRPARY